MKKTVWAAVGLSVLIFSLSFAFSQYVRVKEHNLAVTAEWRACVKEATMYAEPESYDFSIDCQKYASDQYFFYYPIDIVVEGLRKADLGE